MNIQDINPFVRLASHISYTPQNKTGFPRDCRVLLITEGNADIFIENKHYPLQRDTLIYIRDKIPYRICGKSDIRLYVLNFDLTTENASQTNVMPVIFDKDITTKKPGVITNIPFLTSHLCIRGGGIFKADIDLITAEMASRQASSREMAGAILKQLIIKIHRFLNAESPDGGPLGRVTEYINHNFTSDITNKQLAKIAGYHEYHLNRIFTGKYKKSIRQYIIDLRLKHAKKLLASDNRPISEIAEICGFSSNTYFSSYFLKKNGCTPSEYRSKFRSIV